MAYLIIVSGQIKSSRWSRWTKDFFFPFLGGKYFHFKSSLSNFFTHWAGMLIIYMALVWDFSFMREVRNRCSTINLPLQNVPDHLLRCTRTLQNSASASAALPALPLQPLPFSRSHSSKVRIQSDLRSNWSARMDAALRIPELGSSDAPSQCCVLGSSDAPSLRFGLGPFAALARCHLPGWDSRNRLHCCSSAAGMGKVLP